MLRRIGKNKAATFINVIGLSAGLTCFILISLWVKDELSFDKFQTNADRIARLVEIRNIDGKTEESARTSAPMAAALEHDYQEIEKTVRLRLREEIVQQDGKQFLQPGILLTDQSFFDIFSFRLLSGDRTQALTDPYSIVLTKTAAKKYFGNTDPLGQSLLIFMNDTSGRGANYKVTGVVEDPPKHSHFTFSILSSFNTVEQFNPSILSNEGWKEAKFYTYLLLKPNVDIDVFKKKISKFYLSHIEQPDDFRSNYSYTLQPLSAIHLHSNLQNEIAPVGSIAQVYVFSIIGIFILLLAAINYTNLSNVQSLSRAKEVGIKKLIGVSKMNLVLQYLSESVFLTFLGLLISSILAKCLQPLFLQVTGKDVSLLASPGLVLFLLGVTLLLGIISGIYPALVLSSFQPITVLKGSFKTSIKGALLRKSLTVSQFVITLILFICIGVIYSQIDYIKHKDLGYDKNALLFLRVNGNADVIKGYEAFKNDLLKHTALKNVAVSNSLIVSGLSSSDIETTDQNGRPLKRTTSRLGVDEAFLSTYGIKLLAGRMFDHNQNLSGSNDIILNESAVRQFGWKNAESAIGKPVKFNDKSGTVIGVVRDFHYNSFQHLIEPLAISQLGENFSRITVKISDGELSDGVKAVSNVWKKHYPSALFDYDFVDAELKRQYIAEERFSKIITFFSTLALIIATLGLYGLIAYEVTQRTKEIGIRKVLGASVLDISYQLSRKLLWLMGIAAVISLPFSIMFAHKWLQNFEYRVNIPWLLFVLPMVFVFTISLLVIGIKSFRAAFVQPVTALRAD
ncbi:ABC transporter permease [Niabella aquatica]